MKIAAYLSRKDILRMNLYLLPRMRANWIFLAVIWILFVATEIYQIGIPKNVSLALLCLLCSIVGAILVTSGLLLLGILMTILHPLTSDVIGNHEYEITEQGFLERDKSAETLSFWPGIKAIILAGPYIYVRMNALMFAIIPRHSFATEHEFENYYQTLIQHWRTTSA